VDSVVISLPTPTAVTGWGYNLHLCVCLFIRTISQKRTQLGYTLRYTIYDLR